MLRPAPPQAPPLRRKDRIARRAGLGLGHSATFIRAVGPFTATNREGWAPPFAAQCITSRVLDDSNEPATQVARLNTVECAVRRDEPLLERVIRSRRFAGNAERHPPGEV